jgi:hypothetical protein
LSKLVSHWQDNLLKLLLPMKISNRDQIAPKADNSWIWCCQLWDWVTWCTNSTKSWTNVVKHQQLRLTEVMRITRLDSLVLLKIFSSTLDLVMVMMEILRCLMVNFCTHLLHLTIMYQNSSKITLPNTRQLLRVCCILQMLMEMDKFLLLNSFSSCCWWIPRVNLLNKNSRSTEERWIWKNSPNI